LQSHRLVDTVQIPTLGSISSQEMKAGCAFQRLYLFAVYFSRKANLVVALSTTGPLSARSSAWAPQHHPYLFPYLSILIPAYNEEKRIGKTLKDYQDYLLSHPYWNFKYGNQCQIVIADDGSTDGTVDLVQDLASNASIPISCVSLCQNCGKGAALYRGMIHILSEQPTSWIFTADADGSAPLSTLDVMIRRVEEWYSTSTSSDVPQYTSSLPLVVAGYRTDASTSPFRLVFRWGFRTAVRAIAGDLSVRDTQCGCKLVSPTAAAWLYRDLYLPGWSHDVEVFYRARKLRHNHGTVLEVPVEWEDRDGSKLVSSPGGIWTVSAQMLFQVIQLRWNYETGTWKLPTTSSVPFKEGRTHGL